MGLNFPGGSGSKVSICKAVNRFSPWVRKILWRRKWQPTPVLLPGKSCGLRSLVGSSPWGRKELDTTERLNFQIQFKSQVYGRNSQDFLQLLHCLNY